MTDKVTRALERAPTSMTHVDIGLRDSKGRAIGYFVSRYEATVVERPFVGWYGPGPAALYSYPVGTRLWIARTHVTRNGQAYGACTSDIWCTSPEERETAIAKRIAAGTKRYSKAVPL